MANERFQLIETMLFYEGIENFSLHMERLTNSAEFFNFSFRREQIEEMINQETKKLDKGKYKIRLLLSRNGNIEISCTKIDEPPLKFRIAISKIRTDSRDRFHLHKTTKRSLYNSQLEAAREKGYFDIIFLNEKDEITEGAITNIYIEINSNLYTPPVSSGLLNGTIRESLLVSGQAKEKYIFYDDIHRADRVLISNSLIGLKEVDNSKEIVFIP